MKLARVQLDLQFKLPGMERESYTITENQCHDMRYDEKTNSVVFGSTGLGVGWSHVIHWERANDELVCMRCGKDGFETNRHLAGHQRHCAEVAK